MPILSPAAPSLIPAGQPHRAYQVLRAADGSPELRSNCWMTLRSALHRLFGRGKTAGDIARNRDSWNAILDAIQARAGRAVRDCVCRSPLSLPGDGEPGLTVAHRIERGTFLSCQALAAITALFDEARAVKQANDETYARLFTPGAEGASHGPLQALLDGLMLGFDPRVVDAEAASTRPALAETRAYVARQLKLGLQREAADALQRDPGILASALAAFGPEVEALRRPDVRERWLQDFDARIIATPPHEAAGVEAHPANVLAADKERAIAALLSEWRRQELAQEIELNDAALDREAERLSHLAAATQANDADRAPDPASTANPHPALPDLASSPTMASLATEKKALLTALKRREIIDTICRCDQQLSMTGESSAMKRLRTHRAGLVAQWHRGDLAEEKERDRIRQRQLQHLLHDVRAEVDRCTARGERLDPEALSRIVAGLLSRPAYLRQFLLPRNLQFLYDVGHGPDRASAMAQLVRACARLPQGQDGSDCLDASDFHWLAAALEASGENDVLVLDGSSMLNGAKRVFAQFGRDRWPIALICDMAAAHLDAYAEERRQAAREWRAFTASPQLHWRASVAALHDPIRSREWTLDDLAPAALHAFKPFLRARHTAVQHMIKEQKEAERHLTAVRSLYPALRDWMAATPPGACAMTLGDLASLQITARLLNICNLRLEGKRMRFIELEAQRLGAQTPGGAVGPASGTATPVLTGALRDELERSKNQSMRDMMRAKQEIERRVREALDGTESSRGLLEMPCHVLERFKRLWPRWRAAYCTPAGVAAHPDVMRRGTELREMADKALAALSLVRSDHVATVRDCSGLPRGIAERAQAEVQLLEQALDNLEKSLTWLQCMLLGTSSAALIAHPKLPNLPQLITPLTRHAITLVGLVQRFR